MRAGLVEGTFPSGGLRFPNTTEKPPFRTFAEVAGLNAGGGPSAADRRELWDGMFLARAELADLLEHVEATPPRPCVPVMFAFAAIGGLLVFPADPAAGTGCDANAADRLFRKAAAGTRRRSLRAGMWSGTRSSRTVRCWASTDG